MTEPTGHTIDGTPWEEARPPHLPDRLTGTPRYVWAFVVVAVVVAAIRLTQSGFSLTPFTWPDAWDVAVIGIVTPIFTALTGAALFWRHPDAFRTHRRLAIGVTLLAAGELMQVLSGFVAPVLEGVVPADPDTFRSPLVEAYSVASILVSAVGTLWIGRGLNDARVLPDRTDGRWLWGLLGLVILGIVAANLASIAIQSNDVTLDQIATYLVVTAATLLAAAYLTVVAFRGRAAGEIPGHGWLLAALSGGLVIAAAAFIAAITLASAALLEAVFDAYLLLGLVLALPAVLLFLAFATGLPAADAPADVAAAPMDEDGPVAEEIQAAG